MDNPYSAPASNPAGRESFGFGQEGVTQGVVSQLARTKGWVRFLGVIGIIGAGLMILCGVGMFATAGSIGKLIESQPQSVKSPGLETGFLVAAGIAYLIFGLLVFYPALKLNKYASAISRLIYTGRSSDLEDAIEQQRAHWKYVGVMLVLMLLVSVAFIGMAIVGVTALQNLQSL